jgi:hypothetical protein
LGVDVSKDLKWNHHEEKMRTTLRQKVGLLRKLSFNLPRECLFKVFDGLIMSSVRYCMPVYHQTETAGPNAKAMQVMINNAMRTVLGVKRSDRVPIKELLQKLNTLSYNQMGIQATLSLTWQIQKGVCQGLKGFFSRG